MEQIASGFGYEHVHKALSKHEIISCMDAPKKGSSFVEVQCKRGNRKDLGRPDKLPRENLTDFMNCLERLKKDEY